MLNLHEEVSKLIDYEVLLELLIQYSLLLIFHSSLRFTRSVLKARLVIVFFILYFEVNSPLYFLHPISCKVFKSLINTLFILILGPNDLNVQYLRVLFRQVYFLHLIGFYINLIIQIGTSPIWPFAIEDDLIHFHSKAEECQPKL